MTETSTIDLPGLAGSHSESTITFRISNDDKIKLREMLSNLGQSNAQWLHDVIASDFDIYLKNRIYLKYIRDMIDSYERLLYVAQARKMMEPSKLRKCFLDLEQMKLLCTQFEK